MGEPQVARPGSYTEPQVRSRFLCSINCLDRSNGAPAWLEIGIIKNKVSMSLGPRDRSYTEPQVRRPLWFGFVFFFVFFCFF
jgi:hypothetical protein